MLHRGWEVLYYILWYVTEGIGGKGKHYRIAHSTTRYHAVVIGASFQKCGMNDLRKVALLFYK